MQEYLLFLPLEDIGDLIPRAVGRLLRRVEPIPRRDGRRVGRRARHHEALLKRLHQQGALRPQLAAMHRKPKRKLDASSSDDLVGADAGIGALFARVAHNRILLPAVVELLVEDTSRRARPPPALGPDLVSESAAAPQGDRAKGGVGRWPVRVSSPAHIF